MSIRPSISERRVDELMAEALAMPGVREIWEVYSRSQHPLTVAAPYLMPAASQPMFSGMTSHSD